MYDTHEQKFLQYVLETYICSRSFRNSILKLSIVVFLHYFTPVCKIAIGDSQSEHFQALPTLKTACAKFREINDQNLVENAFQSFFLEHEMYGKFGL